MKKYVITLGKIIEAQSQTHPDRARALLAAAYAWVRFSEKRKGGPGVAGAYRRLNSTLAGTVSDSFRHPEKAVMVNLFLPCELLHAMDLTPMLPEGISEYVACTACQKGFAETAEANDVPETFCSYHKTMLGMAASGVLPKPLMIANTTLACDANQLSFRRLAEDFQVPHTVIDIPYAADEDAVVYVADQLRALGAQLEALTGRRLDPQALRKTLARSRHTVETYRAYLSHRGAVSLPVTMTGELMSLMATHLLLGLPAAERYAEELLHSARQAPASRDNSRIYWLHILPNWQEPLCEIFQNTPRCELVGSDISADYLDAPGDIDPEKPYESMARRIVYSSFNGPSERRIDAALRRAQEARAQGIVVFCHWGCKQTMGLSQLAKQTFEAHGLPTLVLDGDGCDSRNVATGQMVTRVNAFLEQLEGAR